MGKPNRTSEGTDVKTAPKLLFGEDLMLNDSKNNIGLNYGPKKVIAYDNYAKFQVIVSLNSSASKIIGLNEYPLNNMIIPGTNI